MRSGGSSAHEYVPSLDGLRALAAVAVIAYHFGAGVNGAAGVTVFFALSGYLITGLLVGEWSTAGSISLGHFYRRRMRRLLPASTVAVIATLVVVWIKHLPPIGRQAQAALTYWANWERAGSHVAYGQSTFAPLTHFWSLAVEEQFYFAFPLLAVVALRFGRRYFAGACVIAFVGSAVFAQVLGNAPAAYYNTGARVGEILAGSLLALSGIRLPSWLGHVALAALVATICIWTAPHLVIAGISLVVIAGRPVALSVRPLTAIGKVSYGLYLYHPLALIVAEGRLVIALPITIAAAVASFFVVERPIRLTLTWPRARIALMSMSAAALTLAFVMAPRPAHQPFARVPAQAAPVIATRSTTATAVTTAPAPAAGRNTSAIALSATVTTLGAEAVNDTVASRSERTSAPTAPATTSVVTTTVPPKPIRISMAGDSTSASLGQALKAWADVDPGYEFVPAPPSADGWADWPDLGLGRGACGLMHGLARDGEVEQNSDDPANRDNVDDAQHAGCDIYKWIPQALATMHLDVLVVSWGPTQLLEFSLGGKWAGPGTPAYDNTYKGAMDYVDAMAATYGTKVVWVAYPDVAEDVARYTDAVDNVVVDTRKWSVDLRSMSRDADPTPLYYDTHHFTPEAAAQAVALIVPVLTTIPH